MTKEKSSIRETSAAKIEALEENVSQLSSELERVEKRWEEKYTTARSALHELTGNLTNTELVLQQKTDENAKLQGDINDLHEQISSTNNDLSRRELEITSLKETRQAMTSMPYYKQVRPKFLRLKMSVSKH